MLLEITQPPIVLNDSVAAGSHRESPRTPDDRRTVEKVADSRLNLVAATPYPTHQLSPRHDLLAHTNGMTQMVTAF